MAGLILNVTDLNSNAANHMRNRQNDIGGMLGEATNIDEKRNETHTNDTVNTVITTSDINSNRNSANDLNYTKKAIDESTETIDESTEHRTSTTESSASSNDKSITLGHHNNGYDDSSAFDSDSDADSDFDDIVPSTPSHSINLNQSSSSTIMMMDKNLDSPMSRSSANNDVPNIGSIAVQNSSDITFGNKTFYQGPVTIKQFVYDKNKWKETELPPSDAASATENDNLGFMNSSTDKLSGMKIGKFQQLFTPHFIHYRDIFIGIFLFLTLAFCICMLIYLALDSLLRLLASRHTHTSLHTTQLVLFLLIMI